MGDLCYAPIIRGMTWSFSRIKAFEQCPHYWFLSYIKQYSQEDRFYTSYGSFMHSLLEKYYRGELTKTELLIRYACNFSSDVKGARPQASTVQKYVDAGYRFLSNLSQTDADILAVEKKLSFDVDGIPFVGVIDLVTDEDGSLSIIDHKSRDLRPRRDMANPRASDKELDEMLRQLYLYASAVEHEYGRLPDKLCFNCFRTGSFIEERYDAARHEEAKEWAKHTIRSIEEEDDFLPKQNYFFCRWLCPVSGHCDADIAEREERR